MSDKSKVIIILSVFFVVLGGVFGFGILKDYLHKNPDDTMGNTAGNLNNGGYFCQVGDKVFFANAYDGGRLYVMNADETGIKRLSDSAVTCLNADDTYVYYVLNDIASPEGMGGFSMPLLGLYRSDHKGKQTKCLDKVSCGIVQLLGNRLYYQRYEDTKNKTLQSMDIQSRDTETVLEFPANPAAGSGSLIYYNGVEEDHNLYCYNIAEGSSSLIYEGNVWYPDAQGGYVYFMNVADGYTLCRYDLAAGEMQSLTQDRVDQYLVCGSLIFYQKNSESSPALMVMNTDGSDARVIAEGNYTNLNATSRYIYFTEFGTEVPMYKISLESGNFEIMTFDAAKEAAMENTN